MARALWKKKSVVVEAEQFTHLNVPDCLHVARVGLTSNICYTWVTPFGGRVLIPPGTWFVTDEEGTRPVPQRVFEQVYRPISVGGRALAMGERVVRKIIGAET